MNGGVNAASNSESLHTVHLSDPTFSRTPQVMGKDDEEPATGRVSMLLGMARSGDSDAFQELFTVAYPELRTLARARLRQHRGPGAHLDTTALVHETFLRFASSGRLQAEHRPHFFRYASRVMRSVIVDTLRERGAERRGGNAVHDSFTTQMQGLGAGTEEEILKVHEALDGLAQFDPRLVDVVQMRYFAGLTDREIGAALGVTERTVRRDWEKARLLLLEALDEA
jgi:RNA polymerase sigma factor (TIGR02999 family)